MENKPIELINRDVAAKYSCTYTHNPIVHVVGIYRGLLSNVTLDGANAMVNQKHPALIPKPVVVVESKPQKPHRVKKNS